MGGSLPEPRRRTRGGAGDRMLAWDVDHAEVRHAIRAATVVVLAAVTAGTCPAFEVRAQGASELAPPPPPPGAAPVPSPAAPGAGPPGPAASEPPAATGSDGAAAAPGTSAVEGDDEADASDAAAEEPTATDGVTADATSQPPLRLVVVQTSTIGIDPIVGQHVSAQLRATGADLGYAVLGSEATERAVDRLRMPFPPTPADLWRLTYVAEAQRGVFARAWAQGGRYVFEVMVASLDGRGPFFERGSSGAADLREVIDGLLRRALPPPSSYGAPVAVSAPDAAGPLVSDSPASTTAPEAPVVPSLERVTPPPSQRKQPRPVGRRWQVALQTEAALGTSQDFFYNHLVGARLDYRISSDLLLGAYLGYANLRGKAGRISNLLPYAQIENRVRVSQRSEVTLPLKLAIGYLPFNGPVVRLAAGINVPLSDRLEVGFDLLTPTFWVLPDRTVVSLSLAAELIFRL